MHIKGRNYVLNKQQSLPQVRLYSTFVQNKHCSNLAFIKCLVSKEKFLFILKRCFLGKVVVFTGCYVKYEY